jgi:hypothetical protein
MQHICKMNEIKPDSPTYIIARDSPSEVSPTPPPTPKIRPISSQRLTISRANEKTVADVLKQILKRLDIIEGKLGGIQCDAHKDMTLIDSNVRKFKDQLITNHTTMAREVCRANINIIDAHKDILKLLEKNSEKNDVAKEQGEIPSTQSGIYE